ncbi:MAG: hypothetical protein ACYTEQ_30965, partial [Planctomycetota bacterium]
ANGAVWVQNHIPGSVVSVPFEVVGTSIRSPGKMEVFAWAYNRPICPRNDTWPGNRTRELIQVAVCKRVLVPGVATTMGKLLHINV